MSKLSLSIINDSAKLQVALDESEFGTLDGLNPSADSQVLFTQLSSSNIVTDSEFKRALTQSRNRRNQLLTSGTREADAGKAQALLYANRLMARLGRMSQDEILQQRANNCGLNISVEVVSPEGETILEAPPKKALSLADRYNAVWPQVRDRWARRGLSEDLLREYETQHLEDLNLYSEFQKQYARGLKCSEIKQAINLSTNSVQDWTAGDKVPWSMRWVFNEAGRLKTYPIPIQASESFAYILGAYLATTRTARSSLDACSRDKDVLLYLKERIADCFGAEANIRAESESSNKKSQIYRCSFFSVSVITYLHHITSGSRQIPFEHLGTKEEQKALLAGFLDFGSGISHKRVVKNKRESFYPYVGLTFTARPMLVAGLRDLLMRNDIFALHIKGDSNAVERLEISGLGDLDELEKIGFRSTRKTKALQFERKRSSRKIKEHGPAEYQQVFQLKDSGLSLRAISRETGIDRKTFARWLNDEGKPERVNRKDKAIAATRKLPDCETVAFLVRHYQVPSSIARNIATKKKLSEIQETILLIESKDLDVQDNLYLLPLGLSEIEDELASRTSLMPESRTDSHLEDNVETYFKFRTKLMALSEEQQRQLVLKAKAGDLGAMDLLTEWNQGVIVAVVKQYARSENEFRELMAAGNTGLAKAIETFDGNQDQQFSDLAKNIITEEVEEVLNDASTLVIPQHLATEIKQLESAAEILRKRSEAEPNDQAIATQLGWRLTKVEAIRAFVKANQSTADALGWTIGDVETVSEYLN